MVMRKKKKNIEVMREIFIHPNMEQRWPGTRMVTRRITKRKTVDITRQTWGTTVQRSV
jgi:hypothetical protein